MFPKNSQTKALSLPVALQVTASYLNYFVNINISPRYSILLPFFEGGAVLLCNVSLPIDVTCLRQVITCPKLKLYIASFMFADFKIRKA